MKREVQLKQNDIDYLVREIHSIIDESHGYCREDEKIRQLFTPVVENARNSLTLKPFDLEAAKQGKPVCTRDGRKARIVCFDLKGR